MNMYFIRLEDYDNEGPRWIFNDTQHQVETSVVTAKCFQTREEAEAVIDRMVKQAAASEISIGAMKIVEV